MRQRSVLLSLALIMSLTVGTAQLQMADVRAADPVKTRMVKAGEITLTVPDSWKQQPATNRFRLAEFTIPKVDGDTENGEFTVFSFGGDGGGVDANVQRWVKQFVSKDRKMKASSGKSPQGDYVLVDLSGTWMKPIGPPIQQRTVESPDSRFLGAILAVKNEGNYFLKLAGPTKTVAAQVDAFRAAIGADAKSEKEYKPAEE